MLRPCTLTPVGTRRGPRLHAIRRNASQVVPRLRLRLDRMRRSLRGLRWRRLARYADLRTRHLREATPSCPVLPISRRGVPEAAAFREVAKVLAQSSYLCDG